MRQDALWLDPHLPSAIGHPGLKLRYRGHWGAVVTLDRRTVTVSLRKGRQEPIRVGFRGSLTTIPPGGSRTFAP